MEMIKRSHRSRAVLTQLQNNTALWIGHLKSDPVDHFAGQIFTCPASGDLDNIQVYSTLVQAPGELMLSIHAFDRENSAWGPTLASAVADIEKGDEETWIRFDLPPMPMQKNETYGFRLYANKAMIALGEAASSGETPFNGQEWHGDSKDQAGHFYNYFSLAFKVEMCA